MTQYGNCAKCGSENLMSQKGKAYCSKKCWLNESLGLSHQVAQTGIKQSEDNKWKEIREEKREDIKWMNAINNACLLIAHGKVNISDIQITANKIYEMEYTGKPAQPTNRFQFTKPDLQQYGQEIDPETIPF